MRTRDANIGSIGVSGLYEFPLRTIDKLWYAYYYNGELKEYKNITRSDDNPFSIKIRVSTDTDPSKIWFFFWAGNKNDQIIEYTTDAPNGSNIASLDYKNKKVYVNHKALNNLYDNEGFSYYDSFAGYYQLSETNDKTNRKVSFTLKRPFAEFHILGDDFIKNETDLANDYPDGVTTLTGFCKDIATKGNISLMTYPSTWFFDGDHKNDVFVKSNPQDGPKFYNDLKSEDKTVTFKDRKFYYYGFFYALAPIETKHYKMDFTSGDTYDKLLVLFGKGQTDFISQTSIPATVTLPEGGIKANTKYIIYNKARSEGGTGWLDGFFDYEILVNHDGTWESPNQEKEIDRATV